jgi:hypothetical protein
MKWFLKLIKTIKFKYSPLIPDVDFTSVESRRNWILFMAQKTGRFPVREVYDKMIPNVNQVTVNNDFKALEEQGLIRREREKGKHSFVVPLFEDSGEAPARPHEKRKQMLLDWGLPVLASLLFVLLVIIQAY